MSISNDMNIDKILGQMRALSAQAAGQAPVTEAPAGNNFAATLKNTLGKVNEFQETASKLQDTFERGESFNVAEVMVASKKAEVTFQATVQVRNKLVQAYKEIMDMPI